MPPPEGFTIRRADAADASRMAGIHVRSKRSAYASFMPAAYLDSLDQDTHRLERWQPYFAAGDPDNLAWVAFVAGIPAGIVALEGVDARERPVPPGYAFLHHLHAAPEFRGRGVGAAMLRTAVASAAERGMAGIGLWTHEPNALARTFYERAGWRHDGERHDETYRWPGGEFTLPNVRYVLALK